MSEQAVVLFDAEAAAWWAAARAAEKPCPVFCGSLKAWAALEKAGATAGVRWLGGLGGQAWADSEARLADWRQQLDALAPIALDAPPQEPIRELLSGDLATPALLSLALLPVWAEELAGLAALRLPVGTRFRPPRFARLGDLPALALAAVLRQRGQQVSLIAELPCPAADGPERGSEPHWSGPPRDGAAWLAIGKLRHPEWPLVQLEAIGMPVVLFEPEPAAALPDLFVDASRWRCHPRLSSTSQPPPEPPQCPTGAALAPAGAWLEALRSWAPLQREAAALGRERLRLERHLAQRLARERPALALVPEENDPVVERFLALMRREQRACAVLHHTAEVQPSGTPLRWQRHLGGGEARLVPLRGQRQTANGPAPHRDDAVLSLDPVRAHLLDALELEAPLPWPHEPAVGWAHYPLLQQALLPLADPLAYWQAVDAIHQGLAAEGVPLLIARKPPLEPAGLSDAHAQGLQANLTCLPFPALLARCPLLIAPGHLGTAHLEAMARGRAVLLVSPARLRRPSLLLQDPQLPMPRLTAETLLPWWRQQDDDSLRRLAADQMEWLRGQLLCTMSLGEWLLQLGVALEPRPQAFLGSGLMTQRPLLERAERVGRLARRLDALRAGPAGRWLRALRSGGRGR